MHTKFIRIICILTVFLMPASGWSMIASNVPNVTLLDRQSEEMHLLIGASIDVEQGEMTYTIQGPEDGGWKSELEWPLDTVVYVGGTASISFLSRLQANIGVWKSVTEDSGVMKDSDWLYGSYGDTKAIYSESDTTIDATQFDTNLRYNFFRQGNILLGAIVGYSYTNWSWDIKGGYQTTIDPLRYYVGPLSGNGITYKETLKVPYLGLALLIVPAGSPLASNLYVLYSPVAQCDDEDDHILRSKLSTGETDGTFFSIGGDLRWLYREHLSFTGKVNYTRYDLDGTQDQYFYAGEDAGTRFSNIDLTIEGSQVYLGLMIGYSF